MSEDLREMADKIRAYVTSRGHDWNIIAAATFCADSPTILWKVAGFVDEDYWITWQELADHVDVSGWSSGEKAATRFACSLAGYRPTHDAYADSWRLGRMLAPLDATLSRLAVEAVRYAAMGPDRSESTQAEHACDVDLVHNLVLAGLTPQVEVLRVDGEAVVLQAPGRDLRITVARS